MTRKQDNRSVAKRREFIKRSATAVGAAALGGAATLMGLRTSAATAKTSMRLNTSDKKGYHFTEAMFRFADNVRKKTNGDVDIKVYPAGSLGGVDVPGTEGVINGLWEFSTCTATNFSNFSNIFQATELPYLFLSKEETYKAADGEPGQVIARAVEKVGLKLLGIYDYGFRNYFNNVREVRSIADMKGHKVRTSYSPLEIAIIKAQGANPTPISWGETIPSLAQGVVDGIGNADDIIYSAGLFEVLKYSTDTKYMYSYTNLLMNLKKFQGLPKDMQAIISEAARDSVQWQREQVRLALDNAWIAMRKRGIKQIVLNNQAMKPFIKATQPVWDEYITPGKAEPELVEMILRAVGRTRKEMFSS